MELGIIGFRRSGKTTVFNTISGSRAETLHKTPDGWQWSLATVKIKDPRVQALSEKFQPKKTTLASVRVIDVAAPPREWQTKLANREQRAESREQKLEGQFQHLATANALIAVVRAFPTPELPAVDEKKEIANILLELIFSDLTKIETRLPKLEKSLLKVSGKEKEQLLLEQTALQKAKEYLDVERPLTELTISPEEEKVIRGFQFVSKKPVLFLINTADEDLAEAEKLALEMKKKIGNPHLDFITINAEIEKEILELKPEEREEFLRDYHIEVPAGERIIQRAMNLLGLISFYTINPNELHVWLVKQGTPAIEAAGMVHSDFQRGFIRAEVIGWQELINADGFANARREGKLRSEGKTYLVQDGEVINFLFSV